MIATAKKSTELSCELESIDLNLPIEKASTIPSRWYQGEDVLAAERQAIFRRSWQCVARSDQLETAGAYVAIDIAGEPVVVVRDDKGSLQAFSNVCRHKAARIACGDEGKAKVLQCRYHGWTYDLTGQLRGCPEFNGVCDFDKKSVSLPSFAVEQWGPLVFVNIDSAGSSQSFADFIAEFSSMHSAESLNKLNFVERREYEIACNWKVFIDNYLDGGYHVPTLHPELADVVNYSQYHTKIFETSNLQISPLIEGCVSSVRSGKEAYYWWMYPNFMVNIYEGLMDTNLVLPIDSERTRVIFDFYFKDVEGEEAQSLIRKSLNVAEQVQQEDIEISEDVQRGLRSSTYDTGRLSATREQGIYHFHRLVAQELKAMA